MTVDRLLTVELWQAQIRGPMQIKSDSAIRDFGPRLVAEMPVMWLCFHQAGHRFPIGQCANAGRFPVLTQIPPA